MVKQSSCEVIFAMGLNQTKVQARNQNTPWRTISKAASVLSAGDTVKVRAGTYREKVAPANSGNATNGYITGAGEDGIRVGNELGGSERNIRIYGNIVFNVRRSGIAIDSWTHNGSVPAFSNIAIVNNTTYGNGFSPQNPSGFGIRVRIPINLTGLVVRNNIAVGNKSNGISPLPPGQTVSDNFVAGDPQFVSSATRDFRLNPGSPAIDTGTPISWLTTDFAGEMRGQGAGYEIGAYEFVP